MARMIRAERRGPARVPAVLYDATERARELLVAAERDARELQERALTQARETARAEHARELLALACAHEQALAALEPQAVEIALQAAKAIVGAQIDARPEQIGAVVSPLIARLRRARAIELRVHPDDCAALEACLTGLAARGARPLELRVQADANVTRGGCVARSEIGTLDAQVETQLAAFARALGVG